MPQDFLEVGQSDQGEFLELGLGPKELTQVDKENLTDFYAIALEDNVVSINADLESGQAGLLKSQANDKANRANENRATENISRVVSEQPENGVELIEAQAQALQYQDYVSPDFAILLNQRDTFNETEKKILDRRLAAERIVARKRGERSEGFTSSVGYFLDTAVSSVLHNVGGSVTSLLGMDQQFTESGAQLAELARETSLLYSQDLSAEEFETRLEGILDRVQDAGVFSEENPFYLETFLSMVDEGGVGWNSDLEILFQVADVVSLGTSSALNQSLKGAARNGSRPKVISKYHSAEEAQGVVVRHGDLGVDDSTLTEGTDSSLIRPAREMPDYHSSPELQARRDLEANNQMLKAFQQIDFGPYVDPAIKEANKDGWLAKTRELNKQYKRRELDYSIRTDNFGNIFGQAYLGRSGSKPFKTQEGAQKFADSVGGEVVEQLHEGTPHYAVVREWAVPTEGLVDATEVKDLASGFFSSIMSTTAKTTPQLDAILKQGEAKTSLALRDLSKQYRKVRKPVKFSERSNVDAVMLELRDDPVFNYRTEPLTPDEFSTRYEQKFGSEPRQEVVEYYNTLVELNDIDYYINADRILKDAVNNGEEMLQIDGVYNRARVASEVDPDAKVYNLDTGAVVNRSDLIEDAKVYEIDGFYEIDSVGFVRYAVSQSPKTRRLYHSDVLPYNVGGHRKYNTPALFFLKQENKVKLAGGAEVDGRPKTFMGVRFEDEAVKAVEQFNNIVDAISSGLPVAEINKVILRNNDWNLSLEDVADLQDFAKDYGLDITKKIDYAPDGEAISGGFSGKGTIGDSFRGGLNASKKRGVRPLVGYGGDDLDVIDPTKSIERGFSQTVARRGEMNYLFNAINGWVKAAEAEGAILNADQLAGMKPKAKLEAAVLSKKSVGKALETERQTIKQRLSNTTALVAAERNLMRSIANWTYGKSPRLAKALDWASTKDPAGFLRAMAFHTKLGMFNIDQIYVQANQIVNIIGVTSATIGPVGAMRGALGVFPMRLALVPEIPEGALKRIAKTQAPFTGIEAEEFIKLRDWIVASGRNIIDRTVVEENNSAAFLGNKLLDWGQFFFKEGELSARIAAATTNFLERKAKGFNEDIFDPHVTRNMVHRQDVLTASMTSASAAPWQRSLMAVPLQFTTYHVRMAEQLFTSEILTPKERVSLLLSHVIFYGAAAIPAAGYLQDKLGYEGTVDPESGLYDLARYGALDGFLTALSGEETALSSRLAVGEGLFDLFVKLSEEPLPTIAAGPGGAITIDSVDAMVKFMKNVAGGQFDQSVYDWNRFARNISSYNKAYINWVGRRYGEMVSRKTESATMTDMNTVEVTLATMGIPLAEQDLLWTTVGNLQSDKKHLDKHIKEITRLDNIVARELSGDDIDYQHIGNLLEDIGAMLEVLQPHEKKKALDALRFNSKLPKSIIQNLMKKGHPEIASKLEGMISNGNP
jgi:hypothetical protein|tara:strand:- start:13150 stop:17493 length:4344 start_codon:yes stop_codon:yes gene_type:complete